MKHKNQEAEAPKPAIAPMAESDAESQKMGFQPMMIDIQPNPIVVKLAHYKGRTRISVRFHYWTKSNQLRPTRRGIEIPIDHATTVAKMINSVNKEWREIQAADEKPIPL